MDGGEESDFSQLVTEMKLLFFLSKFNMEACPQMKYELVVQRKEGHIF